MLSLKIRAIGKLKKGPERELYDRYAERCAQTGKPLGINALHLTEIPESRERNPDQRKNDEAEQLLSGISDNAYVIALDERGKTQSSETFAAKIGDLRDQGVAELVVLIGGADGHGEQVRNRANQTLSFGAMTWPHQIVRILLAEQLYRACSILAGHPYHKI